MKNDSHVAEKAFFPGEFIIFSYWWWIIEKVSIHLSWPCLIFFSHHQSYYYEVGIYKSSWNFSFSALFSINALEMEEKEVNYSIYLHVRGGVIFKVLKCLIMWNQALRCGRGNALLCALSFTLGSASSAQDYSLISAGWPGDNNGDGVRESHQGVFADRIEHVKLGNSNTGQIMLACRLLTS